MNLVKRYRKNKRRRFVLLQNIGSERRMALGSVLNQGDYLIMDMETAGPYMSMAPDQSWMSIYYISDPKEYSPKYCLIKPKYGVEGMAREFEEERQMLSLRPILPRYDMYTYQEPLRRG